MDALGDLLRGVRADGALFERAVQVGPWEVACAGGAALELVVVVRGTARIVMSSGESRVLRGRDAAVVCTTAPFTVCAADPAAAESELIAGAYRLDGSVGRRLIGALPPLLVVPTGAENVPVVELIAAEVASGKPGRQFVRDRMFDWMLACTLSGWFDLPDARPPAWYCALGDEVVGPALRAMHDEPARPWTVAALAARAQISRAAFARQFSELVGRPPMAYLTEWRMALAAELLAEPGATVAAVAGQVGYADGYGFSDAFKRIRGIAPSAYRASLAAARTSSDSLGAVG
ncbi:AraC family transcriptional regulator [Streptomyces sp. NPDC017941]|uniref:AraC family transcriptional regulator n=1 Tax=unclassified Streptomyces TaxID=2593676 RepID=UPI003793DC2A